MSEKRPLHCVFYSHVWAVHMLKLKIAHWGDVNKLVIIELAELSNLAPVFGLQGKARYGLAGLLQLGGRLEQIAQTVKYVPAPIVLAPHPQVSAAALCSAVSMLPYSKSEYESAVLLIHISEAAHFVDIFPYLSTFSIFWDVADEPAQSLTRLAELLSDSQCLTKERWQGFTLYKHPNRVVPDANERQTALQAVLDEYPVLHP
jgi:hypothetical protein